jgi:hypothetical protein
MVRRLRVLGFPGQLRSHDWRDCIQDLLVRPWLPPFFNEASILNLQVVGANLDLTLIRHEHDVSVNVLRKKGDVEIVVVT